MANYKLRGKEGGERKEVESIGFDWCIPYNLDSGGSSLTCRWETHVQSRGGEWDWRGEMPVGG